MAFFPKVQSPCPYRSDLSAVMDGDFCRMCERQVVDLTAWTDGERRAFVSACTDEVCVSYRLPVRAAARAAALAAAAVAMPSLAAAQEPAVAVSQVAADNPQAQADPSAQFIIVGGITDPAQAKFIRVPDDERVPELPVVYDDAPAPVPVPPRASHPKPGTGT